MFVCMCACSLVGEGQGMREVRWIENKSVVRDRGRKTDRERSEDRGSMEISEQWRSLTSGSGVQSLGIDLFKTQSLAIDPQVPVKANKWPQ